jgi:hypothetical protein
VVCGATFCALATSYCCGNAGGTACKLKSTSCVDGAARRCDGPEDCAKGQVCCAQVQATSPGVLRTECLATASCDKAAVICHTRDNCPTGYLCCPTKTSNVSYSICRTQCTP